MNRLRILIHPIFDADLFNAITDVLHSAAVADPETFYCVEGDPSRVNHWGYCSDTLTSVILSQDHNPAYHRLTIIPNEHPVYDALRDIVSAHYGL